MKGAVTRVLDSARFASAEQDFVAAQSGTRRLQLGLPECERARLGRHSPGSSPVRIQLVLGAGDLRLLLFLEERDLTRGEVGLGFLQAVQVVRLLNAEEDLVRLHPSSAPKPGIHPDDLAPYLWRDVDLRAWAHRSEAVHRYGARPG